MPNKRTSSVFASQKKIPLGGNGKKRGIFKSYIPIVPQQPVNCCRLGDFLMLNLTTFSGKKADVIKNPRLALITK